MNSRKGILKRILLIPGASQTQGDPHKESLTRCSPSNKIMLTARYNKNKLNLIKERRDLDGIGVTGIARHETEDMRLAQLIARTKDVAMPSRVPSSPVSHLE